MGLTRLAVLLTVGCNRSSNHFVGWHYMHRKWSVRPVRSIWCFRQGKIFTWSWLVTPFPSSQFCRRWGITSCRPTNGAFQPADVVWDSSKKVTRLRIRNRNMARKTQRPCNTDFKDDQKSLKDRKSAIDLEEISRFWSQKHVLWYATFLAGGMMESRTRHSTPTTNKWKKFRDLWLMRYLF